MTSSKQKVTLSLDVDMVNTLKELQTTYSFKSMSAVVDEAIKSYKQQKKLEKWKNGFEIAQNDNSILSAELELADSGDFDYYEK
ncbi:MAG: type II toxin-antitoxin system CcdA family antitoxin [Campylobacteraceae bacterium]|nr:type II toxin-antitoxin system CcdA family antitoxin [Campylobacteraceae bacterium]